MVTLTIHFSLAMCNTIDFLLGTSCKCLCCWCGIVDPASPERICMCCAVYNPWCCADPAMQSMLR